MIYQDHWVPTPNKRLLAFLLCASFSLSRQCLFSQERKQNKNKSKDQLEKERRRREHQQKTLNRFNKGRESSGSGSSSKRPPPKPTKSKPPPPPTSENKKDSKFQSLFQSRTQGFVIELNFRNAPPRPPVGPCFVGLGLDGELNDKWTRYKPDNAIEANYSWKLHAEPDLGVPLAPSAMDYEGCYVDPSKSSKKQKKNDAYDELFDDMDDEKEDEKPLGPAPLHPDDDALINWKGSKGDTVAEDLQRLRDKARAEARLGIKGKKAAFVKSPKHKSIAKRNRDYNSRVLDDDPFFMKKTTYIANDYSQKVHDFKSLAQSKESMEKEISKKLSMKKSSDKNFIENSFDTANQKTTGKRKHPSKENVEAVFEIPLLPDDETWGHNFIHVVLDSLPNDSAQIDLTDERLEKAFIADVNKGEKSQRMECNLLLADDAVPNQYDVIQKYDLDVIPLKEEGTPHSHFLFLVDEEKGTATYHPISSRVQLSTGRPSEATSSRQISKRALDNDEIVSMEEKLAGVDADLADKYKLDEDDEDISQQQNSHYPFANGQGSSSDEE